MPDGFFFRRWVSAFAYAKAKARRSVKGSFRASMTERGSEIKAPRVRRAKYRDVSATLSGKHAMRWPRRKTKHQGVMHRVSVGGAGAEPWPLLRNRAGATEYG